MEEGRREVGGGLGRVRLRGAPRWRKGEGGRRALVKVGWGKRWACRTGGVVKGSLGTPVMSWSSQPRLGAQGGLP